MERSSLIDRLIVARRAALDAGRTDLAAQLTEDIEHLREPFCDACRQHKPCSCDDMIADRRRKR